MRIVIDKIDPLDLIEELQTKYPEIDKSLIGKFETYFECTGRMFEDYVLSVSSESIEDILLDAINNINEGFGNLVSAEKLIHKRYNWTLEH